MCLQTLVENVIQHNEASMAHPMAVSIRAVDARLTVSHAIQPRSDRVVSSGTGLDNIRARYAYFTTRPVEVRNDGEIFEVALPMI